MNSNPINQINRAIEMAPDTPRQPKSEQNVTQNTQSRCKPTDKMTLSTPAKGAPQEAQPQNQLNYSSKTTSNSCVIQHKIIPAKNPITIKSTNSAFKEYPHQNDSSISFSIDKILSDTVTNNDYQTRKSVNKNLTNSEADPSKTLSVHDVASFSTKSGSANLIITPSRSPYDVDFIKEKFDERDNINLAKLSTKNFAKKKTTTVRGPWIAPTVASARLAEASTKSTLEVYYPSKNSQPRNKIADSIDENEADAAAGAPLTATGAPLAAEGAPLTGAGTAPATADAVNTATTAATAGTNGAAAATTEAATAAQTGCTNATSSAAVCALNETFVGATAKKRETTSDSISAAAGFEAAAKAAAIAVENVAAAGRAQDINRLGARSKTREAKFFKISLYPYG